jgi:hypothetical protein
MMATEQQDDAGDILVEGRVEECPFCDYEGGHLGRHISQIHPEEWADFERQIVFVKTDEDLTVWWSE